MRKLTLALTITYIAALIISCDEEIVAPEPPDAFSITAFSIPERMNTASPQAYDFAYKVTHPAGAEAVAEVKVAFYASDQSTHSLRVI